MGLFTFEHSRTAYGLDFAVHGTAILALVSALAVLGPEGQGLEMAVLVAGGWVAWSLAEYLLHRFVLHGLEPFSTLHALHHERPQALLATPTLLSAGLILVLVLLPLLALVEAWRAVAVTLGVSAGYMVYSVAHHATHHWRNRGAWLQRRRHWHALHHRAGRQRGRRPGYYGITTLVWDRLFGTLPRLNSAPPAALPVALAALAPRASSRAVEQAAHDGQGVAAGRLGNEAREVDMRLVVGAVGDGAQHGEGQAEIGAHLGQRGALHLHRQRVGVPAQQLVALAAAGDEAIPAEHQPLVQPRLVRRQAG